MDSNTRPSASESFTQVGSIPVKTKSSFEIDNVQYSTTKMSMDEREPQHSCAGAFDAFPRRVLKERGLALTVHRFNVAVICGGGLRIPVAVQWAESSQRRRGY